MRDEADLRRMETFGAEPKRRQALVRKAANLCPLIATRRYSDCGSTAT